jgi:hypothetical protein
VAALEITQGVLKLANSRINVKVCTGCTIASPALAF